MPPEPPQSHHRADFTGAHTGEGEDEKQIQKSSFLEPKCLPTSPPGVSFSSLDASWRALGALVGAFDAFERPKSAPRAARNNYPAIFAPLKTDPPPGEEGARRFPHLHFGSLFLKIVAGAVAGCTNRGIQDFRGHSWGWGEKLKLLLQQASLLFKASLREA